MQKNNYFANLIKCLTKRRASRKLALELIKKLLKRILDWLKKPQDKNYEDEIFHPTEHDESDELEELKRQEDEDYQRLDRE